MRVEPTDGFFGEDMIVFEGLHRGGFISRGFEVTAPEVRLLANFRMATMSVGSGNLLGRLFSYGNRIANTSVTKNGFVANVRGILSRVARLAGLQVGGAFRSRISDIDSRNFADTARFCFRLFLLLLSSNEPRHFTHSYPA